MKKLAIKVLNSFGLFTREQIFEEVVYNFETVLLNEVDNGKLSIEDVDNKLVEYIELCK